MRRILICVLMTFLSSSAFAGELIKLNSRNTRIVWQTRVLGLFKLSGTARAFGHVNLDRKHPEKSHIYVKIKSRTVKCHHQSINKTLGGKQFFHVNRYPYVTFKSKKVIMLSKRSAKVSGVLTIRGVSRLTSLILRIPKRSNGVRVFAHTELRRSRFGMRSHRHLVSNKVAISIYVKA